MLCLRKSCPHAVWLRGLLVSFFLFASRKLPERPSKKTHLDSFRRRCRTVRLWLLHRYGLVMTLTSLGAPATLRRG
jgi:hypothetical protein